ncbi:tyrosine-type recombinase/integrase [Oceanicella actignis]|uniref:tyrosine-type recombinase/integrase n=1 Tax=Oceanicella actignis TaxID=1189325 RepID=UPI0011E64418|nr:tyrosine-type recombinase/integrase [Oceanicella actignis]TYO91463.1 phage integrase family protein [Oceanicella actignis]
MKKPNLPYLVRKRGRSKYYWYFERAGERIPLPDPDAPDFLERYAAAKRGHIPPALPDGRTFRRLIAAYRQSARWTRLAPRTRQDYEKVLLWAIRTMGDLDPTKLERRHVLRARDENRDRMRFANYIVQVLSVLCEQAIDMGWMTHNPARGVPLLRREGDGPHKPWPQEMLKAYADEARPGTLARTVMELCIGTGQRIGDVLAMRWDHIRDGGIELRQAKTGTRLWIPFTPRIADYLDGLPRAGLTIVADQAGRPLRYPAAARAVMSIRKRIGATGYTIHGWRYTAAAELAAAGCSDDEIQAITGHKALAMVVKYAGPSRQEARARAAQARRSDPNKEA